MNVVINPRKLHGEVIIPGSKSLTHRAVICAGLSQGKSIIYNPLLCDDTMMTIIALRSFGVKIEIFADCLEVEGVEAFKYHEPINAGDSASTLRFLLPILAFSNDEFIIKGSKRLMERINTTDLDKLVGLKISIYEDYIHVSGRLEIEKLDLDDTLTSQLISGIILTLPKTNNSFKWNNINNPYVELTMHMMELFGVKLIKENNYIYAVGKYNKTNIVIESDFSGAAFFIVMAVLNKDIIIKGLNFSSLQGDKAILDYLEEMGVEFDYSDGLKVKSSNLKGITKDLSLTPDLVPIMASLASISKGMSIFSGLDKLILKESNRLYSTYEVLKQLGADIEIVNGELHIHGKEYLEGTTVSGYNDHRIIMSLVAISSLIKGKFTIIGANYVDKSFPTFFNLFTLLGGQYESKLSK